MALIPIMGQPVNLVPNNERAFGCEPENGYCSLYGQEADGTEKIMFQMKQEPCIDSLISNGNFLIDADWTHDANVVIADGKATHVVGTSGEIYQSPYAPYSLGDYFSLFVTVTGLGAGQIDVYIGSSALIFSITSNGIYQKYWFPPFDNDDLRFEFSADCDGSISNVSAFKLLSEDEITAYLETTDGTFVDDFGIDMIDEYVCFSLPTLPLEQGCYIVQVIDPCESAAFAGLTEVFTGGDFSSAGDWTVGTDFGYPPFISGGKFNQPNDDVAKVGFASQAFSVPTGVKLFGIAEMDTGIIWTCDVASFMADNTQLASFGFPSTLLTQNTTYRKYITIQADALNISMLDQVFLLQQGIGTYIPGDDSDIKRISLRVAPFSEVTGIFTSNCIKVSADTTGTRVVEGFADEVNPYPAGNKSLGFMFHRDFFWLRARLGVQFSNPHTPTSTDNNLSSNGRTKKAYAQLSKAWDLTFHAVDENMHDTIGNIINCDSFQIEGNEYVTDEKEYTANYGENGINAVAESTIEVQKVDGTRFNTNQ